MGHPAASLTLFVLALAGAVAAVVAAPPSAPAGLRFAVYSATAAELFWERSSGEAGVVGYEVARDGEILATRDATSFFVEGLEPGRIHAWTVIAVDADGERSPVASVTFASGSAAAPPPLPPADPGADADPANPPPAPAGARSLSYSATAAELFWTRTAGVVATEVVRDGETLGFSPGTSFFDDTRRPGVAHLYALTALDAAGARSATIDVPSEAFGDAQLPSEGGIGSPFGPDRWRATLRELLRLADGVPVERMLAEAVALYGADPRGAVSAEAGPPGLSSFGLDDPERGEDRYFYRCEGGGDYRFRDYSPASGGGEVELDRCVLGATRGEGRFALADDGFRAEDAFDDFALARTDGTRSRALDGLRDRFVDFGPASDTLRWSGARYTERTAAGVLVLDGYSALASGGGPGGTPRTLAASFRVSAPWTAAGDGSGDSEDDQLAVDMPQPFVLDAGSAPAPLRGTLRARAANGDTLVIDADSGDPATLVVTLDTGGATSAFELPWSEGHDFACLGDPERSREVGCD